MGLADLTEQYQNNRRQSGLRDSQGRSCLYAKYASAYQNVIFLYFMVCTTEEKEIKIDEAIRKKVVKVVQFQYWHFFQHSCGRVRLCVLYFLFQSKKPLKAWHIFFEMYSSNNFLWNAFQSVLVDLWLVKTASVGTDSKFEITKICAIGLTTTPYLNNSY